MKSFELDSKSHATVKSSQVECDQVDGGWLVVDFSLKSGHVSDRSDSQVYQYPQTQHPYLKIASYGPVWMMPIIDIIAEHYRFLLFHMDYKWFDVKNLFITNADT